MSNYLLQRKVSDSQLETVILSIDNLPLISSVTENSTAPITSGAVFSALALKQDTLVSGTNIKTIGGVSVLGSGNIPMPTSADYASANTQLNGLSINGTNYKLLDVKVNDGSSLIIGKNRELASGASGGAVAIGDCDYSVASGSYSTALGYNSKASSNSSTAIGRNSVASGSYSTALGVSSSARGSESTALGASSSASGERSTTIGNNSLASGERSTAIGQWAKVYVPNWVGFDGTSDDWVRTIALKSTDNVFFRNENVDTSKRTQASYTSGKTLTQVLSEKQDTLVSGTNIKTINNTSILGSGNFDLPVYSLPTASTTTLGGVKIDGSTITITNGVIKANYTSYTLPVASATTLGGVKIGTGITITDGVISAGEVVPATTTILGGIKLNQVAADATINTASTTTNRFYPINLTTAGIAYVNVPWTDTTYSVVTTSANGLMSSADKTKLNGIATGATNVVVDSALSATSTNAIQNSVVNTALATKQNTLTAGNGITITDSTIAATVPIYIQTATPTVASGAFALWIDTGNGNIIKFYNGTAWANTAATYS